MKASERPKKRPTQADVARLASVSPAVVSSVVNGRGGANGVRVSDRTAARVEDAIRQLGYVPNVAARSLAGGRNGIVGVFTYEALFPMQAMSYYHPFLVGVEEAVEALDCHLLLFTGSHTDDRRRSIYKNGTNSLQVADGSVLIGQSEDRDELAALVRDGYPAVFIGRRDLPGAEVSYAAADYSTATRQLVERISGLGHRRIARLRGGSNHESILDRDAGFAAARELLGDRVETTEVFVPPRAESIAAVVPGLIEQGYTCLVTDDRERAGDVCAAAATLGLSVPADLSVAALSEYEYVDLATGAARWDITTITTPGREMGAAAVQLLADVLDNPTDRTPRRVVIDCGFHAGATLTSQQGA
ncbi:LacI family DNA-binding transcriptional regulator [Actinophytocola sediminis]